MGSVLLFGQKARKTMWTAIGAIAAALISGVIAAVSAKKTNEQSKQTYLDVQQKSHELNEQSADAADTRTRALYSDLESPEAKVRQLKSAGLSPGLMYGGGGSIGTGQVSPGAQAAPATGANLVQGMDISGILGGLASAIGASTNARKAPSEIKVNEAQTKQIQEQTKKLEKETEYVKTQIEETKGHIALQAWEQRQVFTISDSQLKSIEDSHTWGWSKGDSTSESKEESSSSNNGWNIGADVDILNLIPGGKFIDKVTKGAKNITRTVTEDKGGAGLGIKGGKTEGTSTSSGTSKSSGNSESKQGGDSHGETNSESHTRQVMAWPKMVEGEHKGLYMVILNGDYSDIAIDLSEIPFQSN